MRKYLLVGIVLMVVASLIYVTTSSQNGKIAPKAETGVSVGKNITTFTLAGLNNQMITVEPKNIITVINFWTTWCPPCQAEMPELNLFAERYKQNVDFYGVNLQESPEKVQDFLNKNNYTMKILLDKDGAVAKKFNIGSIPTTIVVDKNGIIKYRKSGAVTSAELEGVIKGL